MNRVAVGFVLGYVLGFAGLYVAFYSAVWAIEGSDFEAAGRRNMPIDAYQQWVAAQYERPFLLAAGVASAMFGVLGARAFNVPIVGPRSAVGRRPDGDKPLTREEFYQVLHACEWLPLEERTPEYVRGLAVGRLAESHPALARKVDDFGDDRMDALHHDLCRKRAHGISR
jgi:hypothetical protein